MTKDVVIRSHEEGHFGIKRTSEILATRFWWPLWKSDVHRIVLNCQVCCKRKGPHQRSNLQVKRYTAGSPFQRIALDIAGPFPVTERGSKYICCVGDLYTKWIEAFPIPNFSASTICELLVQHVISRFGVPEEIHSDRGSNFESEIFALICERLSIRKTRSTPYRPQSDGFIEKFNRTMVDALSKMAQVQKDWDLLLCLILMFYRATVQNSTGCSPALLMLGREINLPIDIMYPPQIDFNERSYPEYVQHVHNRIELASSLARKHLNISFENMRRYSPYSRKPKEIDVSRKVYVFNPANKPGLAPKFNSLWTGPFEVVENISPYLFRIRVGGRRGTQIIHRSHIYQPSKDEKGSHVVSSS
jgi:hypothetical protein